MTKLEQIAEQQRQLHIQFKAWMDEKKSLNMQNNLAQWLDTLPAWCKELKDALATQTILTAL